MPYAEHEIHNLTVTQTGVVKELTVLGALVMDTPVSASLSLHDATPRHITRSLHAVYADD